MLLLYVIMNLYISGKLKKILKSVFLISYLDTESFQ